MTSRRRFLTTASLAALGGGLAPPSKVLTAASSPSTARGGAPEPAADAQLDFETERIRGSIRAAGAYHGVTRLVDKHTGQQVIDSRYSALNLFRLFSVNQGMGQPRTMDRSSKSSSSWLEVSWPQTEAFRGEITARYEVREPNAVDVAVSVRSRGVYRGFEIFLSNYFDKALRPYVFLKPPTRGPAASEPERVLPMVNDVFRGAVLVFPRDAHAAQRCVDGRWERNEFGAPVVQMCPVRHYGYCLALLASPDGRLGVVLMSRPNHCYAISTRYFADNDADRLTTYSAFDLSLFGHDLLPGDEQTVVVRLALTDLDDEMSQPVALYRAFLAEANVVDEKKLDEKQ